MVAMYTPYATSARRSDRHVAAGCALALAISCSSCARTHARTHECLCVSLCLCVYLPVCVSVCVSVCVCRDAEGRTHTRTHALIQQAGTRECTLLPLNDHHSTTTPTLKKAPLNHVPAPRCRRFSRGRAHDARVCSAPSSRDTAVTAGQRLQMPPAAQQQRAQRCTHTHTHAHTRTHTHTHAHAHAHARTHTREQGDRAHTTHTHTHTHWRTDVHTPDKHPAPG